MELLKPFKEMSDTLEGEKYITVSMIQSFNVQIQKNLQTKTTDSSLIRKMKQPMLAKALTRHSGEALNIIKYSSKIDPHFKRKQFNVIEQMEDFLALTIRSGPITSVSDLQSAMSAVLADRLIC